MVNLTSDSDCSRLEIYNNYFYFRGLLDNTQGSLIRYLQSTLIIKVPQQIIFTTLFKATVCLPTSIYSNNINSFCIAFFIDFNLFKWKLLIAQSWRPCPSYFNKNNVDIFFIASARKTLEHLLHWIALALLQRSEVYWFIYWSLDLDLFVINLKFFFFIFSSWNSIC